MSTEQSHDRRPIFVAGYGLASTLGGSLSAAVERLQMGDLSAPTRREIAPGEFAPYFPIAAHAAAIGWSERAGELIRQVMAEAGALDDRGVPLFIASSSIHIGGIEQGEAAQSDCFAFSEQVAHWLEWTGPVFWITTACTSAINALRSAQAMVDSGVAESAVVLGLEIDNRYSAAGFAGMQLLSPTLPQPLAATRDGLVLGEAVAAICLRGGAPVSTCKKNSPTLLCGSSRWQLRGGANVVDGRDPAGASLDAVAAMTRQALQSAGLQARDIDLIKLQAAGSPHNDAVEIAGLREVFADLPALCTLKPLLGHTLGAAGVAELALLLACFDQEVWPLQRNGAPDPEVDARLAAHWPVPCRYVLFVILGFGGGHAALILEDTSAVPT